MMMGRCDEISLHGAESICSDSTSNIVPLNASTAKLVGIGTLGL